MRILSRRESPEWLNDTEFLTVKHSPASFVSEPTSGGMSNNEPNNQRPVITHTEVNCPQ